MTIALGSAVSAAVSASSPLTSPAEHSETRIIRIVYHIGHSNTGMGMRVRGHTCTRTAALAVEEGPSSPVLRPGPIQGMGRAVRCQAHALTSLASARRNAEDENSSTIARTFFPQPAQAGEACSARASDHDDMQMSRWRGRVEERAHLGGLLHLVQMRPTAW